MQDCMQNQHQNRDLVMERRRRFLQMNAAVDNDRVQPDVADANKYIAAAVAKAIVVDVRR
jgi:hypothetical protein